MKVEILYGKEFEINRIKNTLLKIDWYKNHNYAPFVPGGVTVENAEKFIEANFNEKDYKTAKKKVLETVDLSLFKEIETLTKKKFSEEIIVYLTKYGMGGSYVLPNKIILNFNKSKDLVKCVKHEAIHLLVEDDVKNEGLSQEQKEKFVDGLMEELSKRGSRNENRNNRTKQDL